MTVEQLFAAAHLAGDVANPENAVGDTPSTWAGVVNQVTSATSRWSMANPSDALTPAATQTVAVVCRKGANSGDPSVAVNLYEAGTLVKALVADTAITSTTGQTLSGTFTDADVTSGAAVEIEVVITGVGGNASTRNSAQLSTIEWTADVSVAAPQSTGDITQTLGSLTTAAAGTHVAPTFTGAVTQTLPSLSQSGSGTFTPEPAVAGGLLLETGFALLLESGGRLLLEAA